MFACIVPSGNVVINVESADRGGDVTYGFVQPCVIDRGVNTCEVRSEARVERNVIYEWMVECDRNIRYMITPHQMKVFWVRKAVSQ